MIYLNNSDKNLIEKDVLESFNKTVKEYIVDKSISLSEGEKSKRLFDIAINQIISCLNIDDKNLVFTSGVRASSYYSIVDYTLNNLTSDSEIIITPYEKDYIYDECLYLAKKGVKIRQVKISDDGSVDFENLKTLVNENTIMVIVSQVSNDLGIRSPIKTIKQIVKKINSKTLIVSDLSNAIGKININMHDADICFFDSESVCSISGIGLVYHSNKINIEPIKEKMKLLYKPTLELITSFSKAVRLQTQNINKNALFIKLLNEKALTSLKKYKNIKINTTSYTLPNIINISLMDINPSTFAKMLEKRNIFIGFKEHTSNEIYSIWKDEKRAKTSIKISFSTTNCFDDINKFLFSFDLVYNTLIGGEK